MRMVWTLSIREVQINQSSPESPLYISLKSESSVGLLLEFREAC